MLTNAQVKLLRLLSKSVENGVLLLFAYPVTGITYFEVHDLKKRGLIETIYQTDSSVVWVNVEQSEVALITFTGLLLITGYERNAKRIYENPSRDTTLSSSK